MGNNYEEEYLDLIKTIKFKLTNNYLQEDFAQIYLNYVSNVEDSIKENPSMDNYETAIARLKMIIREIKYFDHSVADNYLVIQDKEKNEKNELDEKELEEFIDNVVESINSIDKKELDKKNISKKEIVNKLERLKKKITKLNKKVSSARFRIFIYSLILSIGIYIPLNVFFSKKESADYQTLYSTEEAIYTNNGSKIDETGYYNGMPILSNALIYKTEYLPYEYVSEDAWVLGNSGYLNCYYKIIEKTPWVISGREATRTVNTCLLPVSQLGNVINSNDLSNLVSRFIISSEKEIVYVNEISRSDRDFYREIENADKNIYEIIRYTQDLSNSTTKYIAPDYTELYYILACEFLIWLGMVDFSKHTLIEGIIDSIDEISRNKKLRKEQKIKFHELFLKYQKVYNSNKNIIKKLIKK